MSYDDRQYGKGVQSILQVEWELVCKTPLAIRNGQSVVFEADRGNQKSRGRGLAMKWEIAPEKKKKSDDDVTLASLAYEYVVDGDKLVPYHMIPASSVRGALRSWTMRHLLEKSYRNRLVIPDGDDEEATTSYISDIKKALNDQRSGFSIVGSLFGLAADERSVEEKDKASANAGRLMIETERFQPSGNDTIEAGGPTMTAKGGPQNVRRQMRIRNPLDRMTHASASGGLHQFLEICRNERFRVKMTIANPKDWDLGMLYLWRRELDDGMLRLGALSSIGRGRVEVGEQRYTLWRRGSAPELGGKKYFEPVSDDETDILSGIFEASTLPQENLSEFRGYVVDLLGGDGNE